MKAQFLTRIITLTCAFLAASFGLVHGQNLVNNPSFETVTAEPYWGCELTNATGWLNPSGGACPSNSTGTPDLFSTFSTGQAVLPVSFMGTTSAHTGDRITGIVTYHQQIANYREYMMTQLSCALVPGATYTVSFWTTGGNPVEYIYHSNNIGIYFSTTPLSQTGYNLIPAITPQIEITTVLANSTWTQYTFQFTPTQAFTYMSIGNFRNDASTTKPSFGQNRPYAYYFFDDFSVTLNTAGYSLGNDTTYCGPFSRTLSTGYPATLWSTGVTASQITVTTPGTYWAQATFGCTTLSDTIVISQLSTTPPFLGNDTAYCGNFSRTLSTGNASTVWSTGVTAASITVNTAGTYWAHITNACGTVGDTITLTQNALPVVNLGNDTSLCTGQTLILTATQPGSTYHWQDNSTNGTYNVNSAGTYSVTVTNSSNCSASDAINVTYTSGPPAINIGNDTAYCGNFSRILSTGNASTVWSTGVTSAQITVNTAGTYWASLSNGCGTSRDTIVLTQNIIPTVNLGNDTTLCNGQTLTLNATQPNSTYLWQDNTTNATYSVSSAGTYSVTVTNSSNCSASDAINVTYTSGPPAISLGNDTAYCGNFSRTLSTGNASTLWSTGVTASQITVNTAGTYWASLSNACGTTSDTVILTQNAIPTVNLGPDTVICPGQTVVLDATQPGLTYHWQDNSTASTYGASAAGTYSVTVTNGTNCTASDAVNITALNPPAPFTLGNDTAYCGNFSRTISTGGVSVVWNTGVTATQITVNAPGTYSAMVGNSCGTVTDSITLTQNPVPVVNLGPDSTLCAGQTLTLDATQPATTYQWQDGSTSATYNVSTAGNYAVTVTNSTNCTASDNVNVAFVNSTPLINIGNDTTYCGNFSANLNAGQQVLWSTGITNTQISVGVPGIYWAEASNACGTTRDSVALSQIFPPTVFLGPDTIICSTDSIAVTAQSSATNFLWNTGSTAVSDVLYPGNSYSVQAWNIAGCAGRDSINIGQQSLPLVNLGADTTICGSEGLLLHVGLNGATYLWQDNSTDSFYLVNSSGTYNVTVTTECGSSTGDIKVEVLYDECEMHIPTAFSPNGDGKNDLFRGLSYCNVERYHLQIYNRWGEMVFETTDILSGWDGVFRGKPQPLGVYVYQLEYYNYCQQKQLKQAGNFTLLR